MIDSIVMYPLNSMTLKPGLNILGFQTSEFVVQIYGRATGK